MIIFFLHQNSAAEYLPDDAVFHGIVHFQHGAQFTCIISNHQILNGKLTNNYVLSTLPPPTLAVHAILSDMQHTDTNRL